MTDNIELNADDFDSHKQPLSTVLSNVLAAILADRARQAPAPVEVSRLVEEAKEILDETYRFAATSPRSQENINAVSGLLDEIAASTQSEPTSEAEQSIRRSLNQWPGEAGVWISRRTANAALASLASTPVGEVPADSLRKRMQALGYSDTAINAMGDSTTMMQRAIEAATLLRKAQNDRDEAEWIDSLQPGERGRATSPAPAASKGAEAVQR